MSRPKWNWKKIREDEQELRAYYSAEQYRWIKKVVREIWRFAVDGKVNLPTPSLISPSIQFEDIRFPKINGKRKNDVKGGNCVLLLFENTDDEYALNYIFMRVYIDVMNKDKLVTFSSIGHWDEEHWLGSNIVKTGWTLKGVVAYWKMTVRMARKRGWFGWFWFPFYWMFEDGCHLNPFYRIKETTFWIKWKVKRLAEKLHIIERKRINGI